MFGFDLVGNGGTKKTGVFERWWRSIQFRIFANRESRGDQRSSLKGHCWYSNKERVWLLKKTIVVGYFAKESVCVYVLANEIFGQRKIGPYRGHRRCVDSIILNKVSATSSFNIQW